MEVWAMRSKIVSLLAVAFSLGFAQAASAADMPVKAPIVQAPVVAPFSWTGIYVGLNGGWARDNISTPAVTSVQPDTNGGAFGGQVGFNYQWQQIVVGAEFDGDWLNLKASAPCFTPAFTCNTELNSQFSARGRVGVAFDRFLVYGTGGVAWTTYKGSTVLAGVTFPDSSTRTGWIAGGGVEYAFWNNLIIGAEYLHADYGSRNMTYDVVYPNVEVTTDVVRARVSWLFNLH
jgi:outer membrane immunogenic protein